MSDALDVLDQVGKWKASGKGVAVATVITTWGSSPRPVGSQLGVDDSGAMVGSVSGGCIEGAVVKEALAAIKPTASRGCSISASPTSRPGTSASPAAARSRSSSRR